MIVYIHPFGAGILATLLVETAIFAGLILYFAIKINGGNK